LLVRASLLNAAFAGSLLLKMKMAAIGGHSNLDDRTETQFGLAGA
jgi:hypothetical protein